MQWDPTSTKGPVAWFHMPTTDPKDKADLTPEERDLGMGAAISRRDFLNTVALGAGAALLGMPAPSSRGESGREPWHPWTGYPGEGDYALSNGNTWDVVSAAHG